MTRAMTTSASPEDQVLRSSATILPFDGMTTIAYALRARSRLTATERSVLVTSLLRIGGRDADAARLVAEFLVFHQT